MGYSLDLGIFCTICLDGNKTHTKYSDVCDECVEKGLIKSAN